MNRLILTLICILGTFIAGFSQGQKDPAALTILQAMSDKYQAYDAFEAEFTNSLIQTDNSRDDFEGKVTVMGDKYKLETADQTIINNGNTVWTYVAEVSEMTISDYYPEDEEITVSNIFTIYEEGYKYVYVEERAGGIHVIDLNPEARDKDITRIRMEISGNDELKKFTLFDRSQVRYEYSIKAFNADINVGDSFFEVNESDYPGVEFIDFR